VEKNLIQFIWDLRIVVGYLGEKSQNNWWSSSFLSPASLNFLTPVFSKTTPLAQYNGVCRAASLVHDEHIGLGKHFHLYRLPDAIERRISTHYQEKPSEEQTPASFEEATALSFLEQFASKQIEQNDGPVIVGEYDDKHIESLLRHAASHYFKAFTDGYRCYPYMRVSG
jgi:hypothetical protein